MSSTPEENLLTALCKTGERVTILSCALDRPACTVQEIADVTGITKGLVSRYLALLAAQGILERDVRGYRLRSTALTRHLKILLNIGRVRSVITLPAWAKGIGLYGSWADGTNTTESDLDIWILADTLPPQLTIASLERDWKKKIPGELHLLILTPEKITALRNQDKPFLHAFMRGALTLEGSGYDSVN